MEQKIRHRNYWNFKLHKQEPETFKLPSKTIPDQSMTVKELYLRHAQGLPLVGEKVPIYEGEDPTPDFKRMDLAEIQEYIEENKMRVDDIRAKLAAADQEKKEKAIYEKYAKEQAENAANETEESPKPKKAGKKGENPE